MQRRGGNEGELGDAGVAAGRGADDDAASVLIAGEPFILSAGRPFAFGRADAEGVVGLDPGVMGISGVAGSVESVRGVWWIICQSTKRPLFLEHRGDPTRIRIAPGHRHAVTTDRVVVLEVLLPHDYIALRGGVTRLTTGTLTSEAVTLTERDRDALTALCAGYLESFPRRREHPNITRRRPACWAVTHGRATRCARPWSG